VLVTHDQDDALALSDAMAVMGPGRVLQTGSPREIYRHPKGLEIARHFFQGDPIEGAARNGVFHGGGLSFVTAAGFPDGRAIALLPPESLSLRNEPGPFTVQSLEYAGDDMKAVVTNGRISLRTIVPAESPIATGDRVALVIQAERTFLFLP
jgi:ABC-type Fe3+/spermidine/putrescine transport system ATPase subunit